MPGPEPTHTRVIRVFLAWPSDVQDDMRMVEERLRRLTDICGELRGRVALQVNHWGHQRRHSGSHAQVQLVERGDYGPGDADIVVGLLRHRLGTPLFEHFQREAMTRDQGRGLRRNGEPRTGVEWELDTALRRYDAARDEYGEAGARPVVFVYASSEPAPGESMDGSDEGRRRAEEQRLQLDAVRGYLADLRELDRWPLRYAADEDLPGRVAEDLRDVLQRWLQQAQSESVAAHRTPLPGAAVEDDAFTGDNPYPGLDPYDEAHAGVYFGRESDQRRLRERVRQRPGLLCVAGNSGSGKSSLVRATFTPRAVQASGWERLLMLPGETPLAELAKSLAHTGAGQERALLRRLRQEGAEGFTAIVRELLARHDRRRLLLVVDQFEEVFSADDTEQSRALLDLMRATASSDTPVFWLLTLRSDFLDTFTNHPSLRPLVNENVFHHVTAMGEEALRAVIENPLARTRTASGEAFAVETALTDWLVRETLGENEREENLPLLNYALREVFAVAARAGDTALGFRHVTSLTGGNGSGSPRASKPSLAQVLERSAIWSCPGSVDT